MNTASSLQDRVLWIAIFLVALMTAGLGIAHYQGYNTGMLDLGNMAQAIASASRGEPLVYTSADGSFSRLAGHAEVIYLLIAPLYAFWPNPQLLLIIQAVLFALGAIPVYRLAMRHLNDRFAARCLSLIYLLFPTALTSVLFDFHGDTLAMPLLLFLLDALDQKAWVRYGVLTALVLMCKVYLAIPVACIGLYLMLWGGERRIGAITLGSAVLYGALLFFVIRPIFAMAVEVAGQGVSGYIGQYFGRFGEIFTTLLDRVLSAIVVFVPAILLIWRGWRWLLPGLPVAGAALISTGPGGVYDYRYHHYAIVVPFIIMAAISGAALHKRWQASRPRGKRGRSWRGDVGLTLAITVIFTVMLVDTPLNPLFWVGLPGQGLDPSAYGIVPRDRVKDAFLETHVLPDVPIAASNQLAPHLTNRQTLYLLRYPDESEGPRRLKEHLDSVEFAIADALFDLYLPLEGGYGGGLDGDRAAIGILLQDADFGLTAMQDGLLLFQRNASAEQILRNQLELRPDDGAPAEYEFGPMIALVSHSFEQIGPQRIRASFTWRLTGDVREVGRFVAVSRLAGVEHSRLVHLPSYALYPAWEWQNDQLIVETFDVEIPNASPGSYTWEVGWHNVGLPSSYATDHRSLLPGSSIQAIGTVELK